MRTPVDPCTCKHIHDHFICSGQGTGKGKSWRYFVSVCSDCGRFLVSGELNGEYYRHVFELATRESVRAAAQFYKYLKLEERKGAADGR